MSSSSDNRTSRRDKKRDKRRHNRLRADKRTQHIFNSQRKRAEEAEKKREPQQLTET